MPILILRWSSKKIKRVVCSSLAAATSSLATCMEQVDWMRTPWSQMTTANSSVGQLCWFFETTNGIVGDRLQESERRNLHGKSRRTSDLRLNLPLSSYELQKDLRRIDAWYQIADCLTKHASRKSKEVLQHVINEAHWWITHGTRNDAGDTVGRERERPRRFRQEARAEYVEATMCWKNYLCGVEYTSRTCHRFQAFCPHKNWKALI